MELSNSFLNDLRKLKQLLITNSLTNRVPKYISNRQFLEKYTNLLFKENNDIIKHNPYFQQSYKQEHRVLKLIDILAKSKQTYTKHSQAMADNEQTDSHLIRVNNIIKQSFELTSACYLLEWLQSTFSVENLSERIKVTNIHSYSATHSKGEDFKIHPDEFNNMTNNKLDINDKENYLKILKLVLNNIRAGKLQEAQKIAEYYDNAFLSAALDGGLPFNDLLIDGLQTISNRVDFDLFPPFMKNKDFYTLKQVVEKYEHSRNEEEVNVIKDSSLGNLYWREWILTCYNQTDNENFDKNNEIKYIQSYLSGNVRFIENNSVNIYEHLYFYFLNYLNISVIDKFNRISEENSDVKIKVKSILNIIKSLRQTESYKNELKNVKKCFYFRILL